MSWKEYDENCFGCQPAIAEVDPASGKMVKIPDDTPVMKEIHEWWKTVAATDKKAWHAVTCNNSRRLSDMQAMERISEKMKEILGRYVLS